MVKRWKDPWQWGAEARWKFYVVGTTVIGCGSSIVESFAFYYFLHAREAWAYFMLVGLGLFGGLLTSMVLYPLLKKVGYVR